MTQVIDREPRSDLDGLVQALFIAGEAWLSALVRLEAALAIETEAGVTEDWGGRIADYDGRLPVHLPVQVELVDGRRGFAIVYPDGRFLGLTPLHCPDFL